MSKLTFDDVMEMIGDERMVDRSDVLASALNRTVWVAEWHIPGCMSESRSYCVSKKDAISCALSMANDENGNRGMITSLRKYGRFDSKTEMFGTVINTVTKHKLIDLL
jgi:hypothetical protein